MIHSRPTLNNKYTGELKTVFCGLSLFDIFTDSIEQLQLEAANKGLSDPDFKVSDQLEVSSQLVAARDTKHKDLKEIPPLGTVRVEAF